tara:strand:- start:189 stop:473 length:285 start_codon:yes stop_codon:yes gene_type:complete
MKTEEMKNAEAYISHRLKWEREHLGVPLRMSIDEFNDPIERESLIRDVVLKDRKRWAPEDDSDVNSFMWVAMNEGNWIDLAISSWTASPKVKVS